MDSDAMQSSVVRPQEGNVMRGLRLPPLLKKSVPPSGLLCRVRWFDTNVSGLYFGPIFRG